MSTLNETGHLAQAAKEMSRYRFAVLGLCKFRWNSHGEEKLQTGETLLFSGKEYKDDIHGAGVTARSLLKSQNGL